MFLWMLPCDWNVCLVKRDPGLDHHVYSRLKLKGIAAERVWGSFVLCLTRGSTILSLLWTLNFPLLGSLELNSPFFQCCMFREAYRMNRMTMVTMKRFNGWGVKGAICLGRVKSKFLETAWLETWGPNLQFFSPHPLFYIKVEQVEYWAASLNPPFVHLSFLPIFSWLFPFETFHLMFYSESFSHFEVKTSTPQSCCFTSV